MARYTAKQNAQIASLNKEAPDLAKLVMAQRLTLPEAMACLEARIKMNLIKAEAKRKQYPDYVLWELRKYIEDNDEKLSEDEVFELAKIKYYNVFETNLRLYVINAEDEDLDVVITRAKAKFALTGIKIPNPWPEIKSETAWMKE